jgi:hypothetical protein
MTKPLGFLTFDVANDETLRTQFIEGLAGSPTAFAVDHWSEKIQRPLEEWHKRVRGNIGRCDFLVILVGANTGGSADVALEIQFAKQNNVPFFGVRAEGVGESAGLPPGLPANRTIPWDWKRIAAAVDQLASEGKHHVFA